MIDNIIVEPMVKINVNHAFPCVVNALKQSINECINDDSEELVGIIDDIVSMMNDGELAIGPFTNGKHVGDDVVGPLKTWLTTYIESHTYTHDHAIIVWFMAHMHVWLYMDTSYI